MRNTSPIVRGTGTERITADVQAAPGAVVSGVILKYRRAGTTQFSEVTLAAGTPTASGTPYSGLIPQAALVDGAFIEYSVRATDDQNRSTDSPLRAFRVLAGGIRKIDHIQRTATGGVGDSPFANGVFTATGDLDITAIVTSSPDQSGFVSIQDDATLAAWSGIVLEATAGNDRAPPRRPHPHHRGHRHRVERPDAPHRRHLRQPSTRRHRTSTRLSRRPTSPTRQPPRLTRECSCASTTWS